MSRLYIVTLLFNFYTEYIMRNAGLDEVEARKRVGRFGGMALKHV